METVPFTSSELRSFADTLDKAVEIFGESGKYTELGKSALQFEIEIAREGGDESAGKIKYYDGWIGFYPVEIKEEI